jgi:hypothetical protein
MVRQSAADESWFAHERLGEHGCHEENEKYMPVARLEMKKISTDLSMLIKAIFC